MVFSVWQEQLIHSLFLSINVPHYDMGKKNIQTFPFTSGKDLIPGYQISGRHITGMFS